MNWTTDQIEHAFKFRRDDRGEVCQGPRLLNAHGIEWVVCTDSRVVIALDKSRFNGHEGNFPLISDASNGKPVIDLMTQTFVGSGGEEMSRLIEWAGDPTLGPRPGIIRGTIIDRRLLAAAIHKLPGPTAMVHPGIYGTVRYIRITGGGWRVFIMSFAIHDPAPNLPIYEQP